MRWGSGTARRFAVSSSAAVVVPAIDHAPADEAKVEPASVPPPQPECAAYAERKPPKSTCPSDDTAALKALDAALALDGQRVYDVHSGCGDPRRVRSRAVMFEIVGVVVDIETIATGRELRELRRLQKAYGRGRWRKRKGIARIRLKHGDIHTAEIHWYEAHGIGRKEYKIKRLIS